MHGTIKMMAYRRDRQMEYKNVSAVRCHQPSPSLGRLISPPSLAMAIVRRDISLPHPLPQPPHLPPHYTPSYPFPSSLYPPMLKGSRGVMFCVVTVEYHQTSFSVCAVTLLTFDDVNTSHVLKLEISFQEKKMPITRCDIFLYTMFPCSIIPSWFRFVLIRMNYEW